jgi:hypothetical protein
MDDRIDALIRHNQELLVLAELVRRQSHERCLRCREALHTAIAVYERAQERQRRNSRVAELLTRPVSALGPRSRGR